jgi:hypothetical protein
MVYRGGVITDRLSAESDVYLFLKKALLLVPADEPFRGPREFSEGNWTYSNTPQGTVARFDGVEQILFAGQSVYRLHYSGGLIVGQD